MHPAINQKGKKPMKKNLIGASEIIGCFSGSGEGQIVYSRWYQGYGLA